MAIAVSKFIVSQIFWVTAGRLLSRGGLLATSIILARNLDVEVFAAYSFFLLTVNMLATYSAMGLGVTANRYFVGADNMDQAKSRVIAAMVSVSTIFSLLPALGLLLLPMNWLADNLPLPAWALALGVLVFALEVVPQNALNGLEKYRQDALLSILSGGFVVGMAFYAATIQSLTLTLVGLIVGSLIRVVGCWAIVIRVIGWQNLRKGFPFARSDLFHVFGFSLPMFLISLVASTGPWAVGRVILSGSSGEYALAVYSIGLQWFALGMFLPGSVSRVSVPRLVRSIDRPSIDDPVKKHLLLGLKLSLATSGLLVVFGVLFGRQIMALYGRMYEDEILLLSVFLVIAMLAATSQMLGNLIVFSNHQWTWLKINLVFLLAMIGVAVMAMAMDYGAWAGALSLSISYFVMLALSVYSIKSEKLVQAHARMAVRKI